MTDEAGSQGAFPSEFTSERPTDEETSNSHPLKTRWKRRVTLFSVVVILVAAGIVLPPLINISRYQRQITALMSRSLGRPVHLSGVELRLLPRPGFVLHDLSVDEDPTFGAEPILSARTVVASIRISSLWRGRLMIDRISVDEASLNLVRSSQGRWNLQSVMVGGLMGGAQSTPGLASPSAAQPTPALGRKPVPFPYLEATNSRVNLKNGVEKSPFSIVNTELSLWQDDPGLWRLRLRGQPARTDMEMSSGDTGEVQVEASLDSSVPARELREMPLKLQAEWRDAQLGQLSRLVLGSDAGWRGDLTADLEVHGTPDAAQTKARLRATGVRREEFAPEAPLDFDANCSFLYQHAQNAVRGLGCDTAIGDGLLHLKAELPGNSGKPEAMLEVKQIPLQAAFDLLRTVRSGFAPGIIVTGTANGSLSLVTSAPPIKKARSSRPKPARLAAKEEPANRAPEDAPGNAPEDLNLQGSLIVEGGQLKGGSLKEPLVLPRMTWTPVLVRHVLSGSGFATALGSRFTVNLGPGSPPPPVVAAPDAPGTPPSKSRQALASPKSQEIAVKLSLAADGYEVGLGGSADVAKLRDLAYAFGAPHLDAADSFTTGTADLEVTTAGSWIPSTLSSTSAPATTDASVAQTASNSVIAQAPDLHANPAPNPGPGSAYLAASLQLHHAEWKAPYLARTVELPLATIALAGNTASLASDFTYGPLKGSATVNALLNCVSGDCPPPAPPQVQLHLGAEDALTLEAALLGPPEKKTLLSPLIDRMRSSQRPKWPVAIVDVQADSLILGPATLHKLSARFKVAEAEIGLDSWSAGLLGGSAKGKGRVSWADDLPKYEVEGDFTQISPAALGALLNGSGAAPWSGGALSGTGSIQSSGLNSKQLAAAVTGSVHFTWPHGSFPAIVSAAPETRAAQSQVRFDEWTGTVSIQGGKSQLGDNSMLQGKRRTSAAGEMPFGGPVRLIVGSATGKTENGKTANQKTGNAPNPAATPPAAPKPPTVQ